MPAGTKKAPRTRSSITPLQPDQPIETLGTTPSVSTTLPSPRPSAAPSVARETPKRSFSTRTQQMLEAVQYRLNGVDPLNLFGLTMETIRYCGLRDPAAHINNFRAFGDKLKLHLVPQGTLSPTAEKMVVWYAENTVLDSEGVVTAIARIQAIALLMAACTSDLPLNDAV